MQTKSEHQAKQTNITTLHLFWESVKNKFTVQTPFCSEHDDDDLELDTGVVDLTADPDLANEV